MNKTAAVVLVVVVMVGVIVAVDVLFLAHRFWPRLIVNVCIVLAFGAGYIALRDRF